MVIELFKILQFITLMFFPIFTALGKLFLGVYSDIIYVGLLNDGEEK